VARQAISRPISRSFVRWRRRTHLWRTLRVASLLLRTLYIMNRERSRVMRARARGEYDARPDVEALARVMRDFRRTAVDLGGLLIKLGQFLGARADLLPPEALDELASLHDEVTPEPFDELRVVIERDLHAPLEAIFAEVDSCPAGSASLGQVHHARLKDGREVAIKVQRPGIAQIVRTDLTTLRWVLELVRRLAPAADRVMDLRALYREFSRTVYEELDYVGEGRNAERFARVFADDPLIGAPAVIWEHSSRRVLTLAWVDAIKITRIAELDAAGVDRGALAKQLARFYFRQVLEAGYYHADPHPGNIFVQPTPQGPRLVFVDFGMMGDVTPRMKAGLRDCFAGVVQQDAALVVHGLESLGFLSEAVDHEALEHLIGVLLARFSTLPLSHLRDVDPREIMGDLGTVLYDQPLRLPSRFAFFGRAVGMLMGLSATLSEDFNFAEVAAPYAREFLKRGGVAGVLGMLGIQSVEGLGREALRESLSVARTLAAFPRRVDRLLARAERGELHFVVEHHTGDTSNNGRGGRQLLVNPLKRPVPAWVPLGLVAAIAITQMVRRRDPKSR
jgi:predicted unusual protein kinase regulating ubiquinone biosynthesis (AarF/ABC1/UbiB family)